MSRDAELAERQRKRSLAWGKKQGIVSVERIGKTNKTVTTYKDGREEVIDWSKHIMTGMVDSETLELTPAGELKLCQLRLFEWMSKNPRPKKEEVK